MESKATRLGQQLGWAPPNDAQKQQRDAVHVAVVSAVCGDGRLEPGQRVRLEDGLAKPATDPLRYLGVVDPFLGGGVSKGTRFWVCLIPGTITSLRHDWTHPMLDELTDVAASRAWIEAFAIELDQTYSRLMDAARLWVNDEDYTYDNSEVYKNVDYAKWPIFWKHYEVVTGTKVEDHEATFFTCSC